MGELHRRDDRTEASLDLEPARVADRRLDRQARLRGTAAQLGYQGRRAVDSGHLEPPAGEMKCDPAGAAAELEHGPGRLGAELAPERQVGGVASAFDLVPDDLLGRGHRQYSGASPRALSRVRSSSSAV